MREEKKDGGLSLGSMVLDYFHLYIYLNYLEFFIFTMSSLKNRNKINTKSPVITTLPPGGQINPHCADVRHPSLLGADTEFLVTLGQADVTPFYEERPECPRSCHQ